MGGNEYQSSGLLLLIQTISSTWWKYLPDCFGKIHGGPSKMIVSFFNICNFPNIFFPLARFWNKVGKHTIQL